MVVNLGVPGKSTRSLDFVGNKTKYLPASDNENRLDLNCQVPHSTLRFAGLCGKQAKREPLGLPGICFHPWRCSFELGYTS